jgi:ligand-binding sensor domain-containing protein
MPVALIQAQSLHAINYTVKDGLPSNEVYWMLQANNGLIWIGCDAGLVSFDGVNFKEYPALNSRGKAISNVREDEKGTIWCHNFAGQIFFIQNDSLRLLKTWEEYTSPRRITGMRVDTNQLYIESTGSSWIYNIKKNQLSEPQRYLEVPLTTSHTLRHSIIDTGFQMITKEGKQIITCPECFYYSISNSTKRHVGGNWSIKEDLVFFYVSKYDSRSVKNSTGSISQSNIKIPFVFKLEQDTFKAVHFPESLAKYGTDIEIIKLKFSNDSIAWVATNIGLFQWNLTNNTTQQYFKDFIVSDVIFDREGNLWASTVETGIYLVPSLKPRLYDFITKEKKIHHIAKDKHGNLLIGYGNGSIVYWDIKNKKALFKHQFAIKKNIACISYNEKKDLFLIASQKKIYTFKSKGEILKNTFIGGAIKDIEFDNKGNILVAFGHAAAIYSNELTIKSFPNLPDNWKKTSQWKGLVKTKKILPNQFHGFRLDPQNQRSYSILAQQSHQYTIWIGFVNGLKYFTDGKIFEFKTPEGKQLIVKDLVSTGDSLIWAATLNDGLYCIQDQKIKKHLTTKNGLPSNNVRQIGIYGDFLWLVTDNGLVRYHKETGNIVVWDKSNGLPSLDILDIEFLDNKIFLTDGERLLSVPLDFKNTSHTPPLVDIIQFEVNDSTYNLQDNYDLSYHNNNIEINFRGLSYKSLGGFQYKYKLHPVEKKWNFSKSINTKINYFELAGGDYTFEVRVVNPDGRASKPKVINFSIGIPFYQQWWFIVSSLFFFVLIIWWQYKVQIDKINKQNEEKLNRSNLERDLRISELKALKAQLNPHFIFNALNSIQDYIILNKKELASDYLGMFADLIRTYLNHSQEGAIGLDEEIEALKLYLELEAIRFDHELDFSFEVDPTLDIYNLEIPTMLLQPYVENAIKHGLFYKSSDRKLKIFFKPHSEDIILAIVRDNGIGREASALHNKKRKPNHKSFATSANKTRLELLNYGRNQQIKAEIIDLTKDGKAIGTEVHILIPLVEI